MTTTERAEQQSEEEEIEESCWARCLDLKSLLSLRPEGLSPWQAATCCLERVHGYPTASSYYYPFIIEMRCQDLHSPLPILEVQRSAKRYANLTKQDPSRARQNR